MADLIRIGMESFALVEEPKDKKGIAAVSQGLKRDCVYKYQSQQTHLYQVKPISANETMIRDEVVQFLDGSSIMDHSKRKSVATAC